MAMRAVMSFAAVALLGAVWPGAAAAATDAVDFEQSVPKRAMAGMAAAGAHPGGVPARTVRAPGRFDLLGLRWRAGQEPDVWVRVRRSGRWSRWVYVPHSHGPLRRRGEEGSDPVWAGGADAYQLRLSRPVRGLRAHFVRVRRPKRRAARAAAAPGQPAIVSRAAWGASSCQPRESPSYGRVDVAFVHHTVNANDYTPEESPAIVLAICRYHRNSNGWSDIGYNFLVDRHGQVFEGRAGGTDRAVVGAQAAGYNSVSTGVSNIGEFSNDRQTAAGMDALSRILAWKLGVHGVPAEGTVTTAGRTFQRISGHRDANSTACPGDALYAQLPELRRRVAAGGALGPRGLTLEVARRVRLPAVPTFAGLLADAAGAPLAGRGIELQARLANGEWRAVGGAVTGLDGAWSIGVPTTRSGSYRAHFAGDGAAPAATSPTRRVAIVPRIEARATQARVRRRQRVTLVGTTTPAKRPLEVLVWRRSRGANRFAGRFGVVERGSRFTARVRVHAAALYRFQIAFRGDAANAAASSNVVWVRATR
jgi:N-acetylmuramoyl-L-alanine amidase